MSDSLLKALKIFVVVGAVVIVLGTATLIALLVKRAGSGSAALPAGPPATGMAEVALPPGAEVQQVTVAGAQLYLLGRSPGEGQFILVIDQTSGARKRLLRLVPEAP